MILSKSQKGIYEVEKLLDFKLSTIHASVMLDKKYDEKIVVNAIKELFKINDALRIHIVRKNNDIEQEFIPYKDRSIDVLKFKNVDEIKKFADKYKSNPFALNADLVEIKAIMLPDRSGFFVDSQFICLDEQSLYILADQFMSIVNGEKIITGQYIDFINEENKYLKSKNYLIDKEFYLNQLKKCDDPIYLSEKNNKSLLFKRKTFIVNKQDTAMLKQFCYQNQISPYAFFLFNIAIYFSRIKMNADKFYINIYFENRVLDRFKNTVGLLSNSAPMLFELDDSKSAFTNLLKVQSEIISMLLHQRYNHYDLFSELKKDFRLEDIFSDCAFYYKNRDMYSTKNADVQFYYDGKQVNSLEITVNDYNKEGYMSIEYDYQIDKFSEEDVDFIYEHILNLLKCANENIDMPLRCLNILSKKEEKTLLVDYTNTYFPYDKNKCVHTLFEEQVIKKPNNIALVATDKTLTYSELNSLANIIANNLLKKGVKNKDIVAFALPRRSYLIASMLAILKVGATYLPIDPSFPKDRIDIMIKDSNAKIFINETNIKEFTNGNKINNLNIKVPSNTACYCIYTSGSTGTPKGVSLTHQNVVNYLSDNKYNLVNSYIKKHYKSIVSVTTCSFDIFVTESLFPLTSGLKIILANEEESKIPSNLDSLILKNPSDVLQTTPSKMKILISDSNHLSYLKKLKAIILGGEALDIILLNRLRKLTNAQIFNIYGPTETTVWSTNLNTKNCVDEISIGKPIANTQIYIVDKYLNLMPIGAIGEVCIAGDGVGLGYLNREELNKEKFVDNPFGEGKLYKTGDLAYWGKDRNIMYVGRNDFQIKIRGLRIELGEIENAILKIEGVQQVVVVVRKNNENRQMICAFYTGKEMSSNTIRSIIEKSLPKYMLPHFITYLKNMPTTISGKIDRKALPIIDLDYKENTNEYIPPRNELEKALCRLYKEVLNVSKIGIKDNFFELGGDSLKAIELVSKARSENIVFSLQDVFDNSNVSDLANRLNSKVDSKIEYKVNDFTIFDKLIKNNTVNNAISYKEVDMGNVLITGTTGFLGAHLLADFLDNEKGIAYCLVRGESLEDSINRLNKNLEYYFLDKYKNQKRIRVINGDLSHKDFALSQKEYKYLIKNIDTIFHAAASVKNFGSYEFFKQANVDTTKRVVEFAIKSKAKLIHISTTSVSSDEFSVSFLPPKNIKQFLENKFYIGQSLNNVYVRSKFEAEKVVLDGINKGLKANIMRMGNLSNRYCDIKFQKNYESNAFLRKMRSFISLGYVPDYLLDTSLEFSPVDLSSRAVMLLAKHFNMKQTIFHIKNLNYSNFSNLVDSLKEINVNLKVVKEKEFKKELSLSKSNKPYIYEGLITNLDKNNNVCFNSDIYVDATFTTKLLEKYYFSWPKVDKKYLQNYYLYFEKLDYFK